MQAYSIDYEKGKADFQNFDKQLPSPLKKPQKNSPQRKTRSPIVKTLPRKGGG